MSVHHVEGCVGKCEFIHGAGFEANVCERGFREVRSCLFARTETDLRALLRGGSSDVEIAEAWRTAMWGKLAGHGIDEPGFLQPDRPTSAIGG